MKCCVCEGRVRREFFHLMELFWDLYARLVWHRRRFTPNSSLKDFLKFLVQIQLKADSHLRQFQFVYITYNKRVRREKWNRYNPPFTHSTTPVLISYIFCSHWTFHSFYIVLISTLLNSASSLKSISFPYITTTQPSPKPPPSSPTSSTHSLVSRSARFSRIRNISCMLESG